jgi:hypothetical protein
MKRRKYRITIRIPDERLEKMLSEMAETDRFDRILTGKHQRGAGLSVSLSNLKQYIADMESGRVPNQPFWVDLGRGRSVRLEPAGDEGGSNNA